ncbi:hypothetical protein CFC21_059880 [Triticum aestivum]|uniref:Late embryogenesis abundant protein LEA-2 subgroup domain-containing protein n=2 Tax=Triticum aestivum TaxID=4565 RepID=A0A9R1GRZ2_WHEAT|nr:hypothetical protein CFC21_059880 [Triticum aestivum]
MGDIGSRRSDYFILAALALVPIAAMALLVCLALLGDRGPLYSAAIDAATGLDAADLGRHDLSPLFNLTLRVASRSLFSGDCTAPGAVVEVSYAGVPLAAGPVPRFCTKPREARELRAVVAWGEAVKVPGFVLDGLAADARRGTPVFDVAVTMPGTHWSGHHGTMVSCSALRVGDTASLGATCAASDVDTVVTLPRPSGKLDGGAT